MCNFEKDYRLPFAGALAEIEASRAHQKIQFGANYNFALVTKFKRRIAHDPSHRSEFLVIPGEA